MFVLSLMSLKKNKNRILKCNELDDPFSKSKVFKKPLHRLKWSETLSIFPTVFFPR
jgi:hypothetical protein